MMPCQSCYRRLSVVYHQITKACRIILSLTNPRLWISTHDLHTAWGTAWWSHSHLGFPSRWLLRLLRAPGSARAGVTCKRCCLEGPGTYYMYMHSSVSGTRGREIALRAHAESEVEIDPHSDTVVGRSTVPLTM